MSVRDAVLAALNETPGVPRSGEALAAQLGVSRAAVWKAIETLRSEGVTIEAAPRRGYCLPVRHDLLTADAVSHALPPDLRAVFPSLEVVPELPGTNAALRTRAEQGAAECSVLIAAAQTEGRGRAGRSFYSPPGTGLYLSLLLRPTLAAEQGPLLTALTAVAVCRAVETLFQVPLDIKWVNDLYHNGHKVCGILTEAAVDLESGGLWYVIVGVGFNLCSPPGGWPEELRGIAGGLFDGTPPPGSRAQLAAAFLTEFQSLYASFDPQAFLPEYRRRQMLVGQEVQVLFPGQTPRLAVALGVDDAARLLVRYTDTGEETALHGGEVRARPRAL